MKDVHDSNGVSIRGWIPTAHEREVSRLTGSDPNAKWLVAKLIIFDQVGPGMVCTRPAVGLFGRMFPAVLVQQDPTKRVAADIVAGNVMLGRPIDGDALSAIPTDPRGTIGLGVAIIVYLVVDDLVPSAIGRHVHPELLLFERTESRTVTPTV